MDPSHFEGSENERERERERASHSEEERNDESNMRKVQTFITCIRLYRLKNV